MTEVSELAKQLESELMQQYGPMLRGQVLIAALGYPSQDAFRQAYARGTVPVSVFPIERRRGKHALARDVARWLAEQRLKAMTPTRRKQTNESQKEAVAM